MKLHLPKKLLCAVLTTFLGVANATTVTGPDYSYSYRGGDYIATETKAQSTTTALVVNLDKLKTSSKNCSAASGASNNNYLLGWFTNNTTYGLVATEDGIKAAISAKIWDNSNNVTLSYDTLSEYADADGNVSLTITNTHDAGVTIEYSKGDESGSTKWNSLQYSSYNTTHKYYFNSSFVKSVTLDNDSTRLDNLAPYIQKNEGAPSIGRVLFAGDSITHGINESTWRWQLFKSLTDNGIENEIAGPNHGYSTSHSYRTNGVQLNITSDAGQKEGLDVLTEQYGNATFDNSHLAQASGRVRNMLAGTLVSGGASYGGEWKAAGHVTEINNYDTVVCLIGTNDLLSDSGFSNDKLTDKIQTLLGGSVKNDDFTWSRTENDSWGTMGDLVNALLPDKKNDQMYLMTIPVWYKDIKDKDSDPSVTRQAVKQYNKNYAQWVESYNATHGTNIKLVNINRGLEDVATNQYKGHLNFFYNASDGLHPNEQGSLIIAGNLAQAMNIGGRTAGLERQGTSSWNGASIGTVAAGTTQLVAENAFTMTDGYTIDFAANFGNGAADGWQTADNALSISLGDGTNSGTLNLTEGYIMWGSDVLFCWDNSTLADEGNLRIAWHNGNTADNVLSGYYVWLGDMLIGQGLDATTGEGLNGIQITANGANGTLTGLTWTDQAYAPTTEYRYSAEHAYLTTQELPLMSAADRNNTPTSSGVTYGKPTPDYAHGYISTNASTSTYTFALGNTDKNTSGTLSILKNSSASNSATINTLIAGNIHASLIGVENGATATKLVLETNDDAVIQDNTNMQGAIVASYGGNTVQTFELYVNGGTVGGDIVGGESKSGSTGAITRTNIYINNGTINGNILGGGKSANGSVGNAAIRVNGGTISGSIIAGGTSGTIGNTDITITGGIIEGGIEKGAASRTNNGVANVTIIGNKASIGGDITADNVTLRDVTGTQYSDSFDKYAGTISTTRLTLDNVQVALKARLSESISTIEVENSSNTSAVMGDAFSLSKLFLSNNTTFSAYKADTAANSATSEYESSLVVTQLEVGKGATLNANLVFNDDSVLILDDFLTMGSDVALASGMSLTLSDTMLNNLYGMNEVALFAGVDKLTLDGQELADGTTISANSIFSNLDPERNVNLSFSGGTVSIYAIPEPATATLSLLALAGLAMRRRRRG